MKQSKDGKQLDQMQINVSFSLLLFTHSVLFIFKTQLFMPTKGENVVGTNSRTLGGTARGERPKSNGRTEVSQTGHGRGWVGNVKVRDVNTQQICPQLSFNMCVGGFQGSLALFLKALLNPEYSQHKQ